jgi:hypothetical protein
MLSHIRSLAGSTIDTLESSFRKRQHKITNRLEAGQRLIIQFSQVRLMTNEFAIMSRVSPSGAARDTASVPISEAAPGGF